MENENYMIEFKDNEGTQVRINKIKDAVNWLCHEMQQGRVNNNKLILENDIDNMTVPLSIAFVKMAEKGDIDEITASEHIEMFLPWDEKSSFEVGSLRTRAFENETKLYQCLQAHTGQADWKPENAPALWKELVIAKDGIPVWSQPISVMDAYMKDSEVWDEDQIWVSDYDNNVWKPGTFGWHIKGVE